MYICIFLGGERGERGERMGGRQSELFISHTFCQFYSTFPSRKHYANDCGVIVFLFLLIPIFSAYDCCLLNNLYLSKFNVAHGL